MWSDLRNAFRALRAAPGFTVTALTVLALGVGASTAIFSVVDAIVLRGLPFDDANRIVSVAEVSKARAGVVSGSSAPQNFLEWLIEGLYNFLEGLLGSQLAKQTFWFFATVFIFILSANWFGLVPGVGSMGWGHRTAEGFQLEEPLFRGANADVNLTLAMALTFFAMWIVWGLRALGPVGFLKELFAPKGSTTGVLKMLMVVVFLAAGLLEVVSILFRPVSLSFRLYGNVFAGETMLETMAQVPYINWLVQIPFYFLELLVGLVQALVFMLLTAVFTLLICQHHEEGSAANH